MIYLLAGARAAMRHASRQSSCSDGIIARSADARPRTSIRCALPAHADQKEISAASRLHRRPGSADFCRLQNGVPPSELRASRPRHHASERWSGRWITLSLATLASVKVSKTAPDKTVRGRLVRTVFADRPRIAGHSLPINMIRQSLPRLQVPLR